MYYQRKQSRLLSLYLIAKSKMQVEASHFVQCSCSIKRSSIKLKKCGIGLKWTHVLTLFNKYRRKGTRTLNLWCKKNNQFILIGKYFSSKPYVQFSLHTALRDNKSSFYKRANCHIFRVGYILDTPFCISLAVRKNHSYL